MAAADVRKLSLNSEIRNKSEIRKNQTLLTSAATRCLKFPNTLLEWSERQRNFGELLLLYRHRHRETVHDAAILGCSAGVCHHGVIAWLQVHLKMPPRVLRDVRLDLTEQIALVRVNSDVVWNDRAPLSRWSCSNYSAVNLTNDAGLVMSLIRLGWRGDGQKTSDKQGRADDAFDCGDFHAATFFHRRLIVKGSEGQRALPSPGRERDLPC